MMDPIVYRQKVQSSIPRSRTGLMFFRAYLVGGIICCIGQLVGDLSKKYLSLSQSDASTVASVFLVFLAGLLTAIGVFDSIASFAGAGTVVPITGFANSIISPAIEFKTEGLVLGTCVKMFTIAGPVLVYGITASALYGLVLFLLKLF